MNREEPRQGEIYKHFKDKLYQIVAIATHSETGERLVIYQRLYEDFSVYARPLSMFMSEVDHVKYPQVTQKYRFEKVTFGEVKNEEKPRDAAEKVVEVVSQENDSEIAEDVVNPDLLEFLNADTYEQKKNVLVSLKHRITDRLIDDIAMSMDVTVDKGDVSTRYASLLSCIDTMAKYEITRF